jgi:hypothetical protein
VESVLAGGDQQSGGVTGGRAEQAGRAWRRRGDERDELLVALAMRGSYTACMSIDVPASRKVVSAGNHDDQTIEWRELQFARLGFENAGEMARSDADWHEAAALIAAGARPEDLFRIMR